MVLNKIVFLLVPLALLVYGPAFAAAHAEVAKIVDENNFVSFYATPLSPLEGERVSFTLGFVENLSLVKQKISANYSVVELSTEKKIYENNLVEVRLGASNASFVLEKPGLYELRVDYAKESAPAQVLSADYQLQVRAREKQEPGFPTEVFLGGLLLGGLAGAGAMIFSKKFW